MLFSFVMLHNDLFKNQKTHGMNGQTYSACLLKKNLVFKFLSPDFISEMNEKSILTHFLLNFCKCCELSKDCIVLAASKSKRIDRYFFVCSTTTKYVQSKKIKTAEKINNLCEIESLSFMLR